MTCLYQWMLVYCAFYSTVSWGKAENKMLNVMAFFPMTGNVWTSGTACMPAFQMALEHVHATDGLLDGYTINMTWRDSKVSQSQTGIAHVQSVVVHVLRQHRSAKE